MKKFILTITILLCVVGFSGCSEETSFEAFNNCNCVDNPQEAIIGLWEMTGAFTADGKYYEAGYDVDNNSALWQYMEFRSDDFLVDSEKSPTWIHQKPPERTYQIFQDSIVLYWVPPSLEDTTNYYDIIYWSSHCYKYCLTDNNNELIVQHIRGYTLGIGRYPDYSIFIYRRRQ